MRASVTVNLMAATTAYAAAAAASSSIVAIPPRGTTSTVRCSAFPFLPTRLLSQPFPSSIRKVSDVRRCSSLRIRASEESSAFDADEIFQDLKQKWDAVENKSTVFLYGGGAIVAVWLTSVVVTAINSVPLLPKIMELVGLGYTGWFVYRYLLFKSSRKELATDIEELKKKIAGSE